MSSWPSSASRNFAGISAVASSATTHTIAAATSALRGMRLLNLRAHGFDERLQLRAHGKVDALAGRQSLQEPALVLALHLAVLGQGAERIIDELPHLRIVAPIHDGVRVI